MSGKLRTAFVFRCTFRSEQYLFIYGLTLVTFSLRLHTVTHIKLQSANMRLSQTRLLLVKKFARPFAHTFMLK